MSDELAQAYIDICLTQGRYAVGLDSADFALVGSAFVEDATFQTPAGVVWEGRATIVENLSTGHQARKGGAPGIFQRHHVTTRHVVLDDPMTASVDSYFVVTTENGLDFSGTYKDLFRKEDGGWLIGARVITCDWLHPQSRFASPTIKVRARGDLG
ncbi:nuclear transport factor 2 family protein [Sinisalibacter aestuarii]|uniref:SnoaL-like domain-containing protein n=1 Tax=Sinisalibacter aestuarii TaxID=2949426 RepID=A0ABQ5LRW7_9RHOB|nr:nuclear transport factor 2 family protein [Sinisalibacter aestuarii]GKY87036.1 hypothetical protein STA1M1_09050 [Sinisalibacter aestuarii]